MPELPTNVLQLHPNPQQAENARLDGLEERFRRLAAEFASARPGPSSVTEADQAHAPRRRP